MLCVVDYGLGNLNSIANMLKRLVIPNRITSSPDDIRNARALVLPGVGAFDAGVTRLMERGLVPALNEAVLERRVPILGICLGMQLMARSSEEGKLPGLGWIDATVRRFDFSNMPVHLPVPHMAWSEVSVERKNELTTDLPSNPRYYFVHSYYVECDNPSDVLLTAMYGKKFVAAFQHRNMTGFQFHPEKSHRFGMALLQNYIRRAVSPA
jgi:glutamine amidotransferase